MESCFKGFNSLLYSLLYYIIFSGILFIFLYTLNLKFQWYLLDEKQKEYFTGWILWCEIGSQYIPLSFLLGFFVAVVVARWLDLNFLFLVKFFLRWEQFNWISWPDKMMVSYDSYISVIYDLNSSA